MKAVASDPHLKSGKGPSGKTRYAVIGLGYIAQSAVLPAFKSAKNSELTALVSDDPVKLKSLGKKYGVTNLFSYQQVSEALATVDAVFIALPNTLHRAYTELAAAEGVHVLCEKPMAMSEDDCDIMIDVCRIGRVKLMIGYRLHFEKANLEAIDVARNKLGDVRSFSASFIQDIEAGNLRLVEGEGGPLYDIGIYCVNAARSIFKAEPVEVFAFEASRKDPRFKSVPEMVTVNLRFPDARLATFTCSFGAAHRSWYEVSGTKGALRVEPAYEIAQDLAHALTVKGRLTRKVFKARDQFAAELVYFSDCIQNDRNPEPSGDEGLADVRVMRAIEKSIEDGVPVKLEPFNRTRRPTMRQEIERPTHGKPKLVNAQEPSPGD